MRAPFIELDADELWFIQDAENRRKLSTSAKTALKILQSLAQPGVTTRGVARQMRVSRMRISRVVRLYRASGVAGVLVEEDAPIGRPPLPEEKRLRVLQLGAQNPRPAVRIIAERAGVSAGAVSELLRGA